MGRDSRGRRSTAFRMPQRPTSVADAPHTTSPAHAPPRLIASPPIVAPMVIPSDRATLGQAVAVVISVRSTTISINDEQERHHRRECHRGQQHAPDG